MALDGLTNIATGLWDNSTGYVDKLTDFIYGSKSVISRVDLEGNALNSTFSEVLPFGEVAERTVTGTTEIEIDSVTELSYSSNNVASKRQVESMSVFNDTIRKDPPSLSMTLVISRDKIDRLKEFSDNAYPINITINKWKDRGILDNGILQLYYISSFSIRESYRQKNTVTVEIVVNKIRTFKFYTKTGIYSKYNSNSPFSGVNPATGKGVDALDPSRNFIQKVEDFISASSDCLKGWFN